MNLINISSVWDLQVSLQGSLDKYTINQLKEAIRAEKQNRNRTTVIKLLQRRIDKLERMAK